MIYLRIYNFHSVITCEIYLHITQHFLVKHTHIILLLGPTKHHFRVNIYSNI